MKPAQGLIAILDALGASGFSETQTKHFIASRKAVLALLDAKLERVNALEKSRFSIYTFNDTIVLAYTTDDAPAHDVVVAFGIVLRHFLVKSLEHQILFRGAVAIGKFKANPKTNTVLGPAVSDAASWYDKSDWIGVVATPRTSLLIEKLEIKHGDMSRVVISYPVPTKSKEPIQLRAINWPKGFFIREYSPVGKGENHRGKCIELLTQHAIPYGTESKYFNSLRFFDHCVAANAKKIKQ
jgi:hypothetical protein